MRLLFDSLNVKNNNSNTNSNSYIDKIKIKNENSKHKSEKLKKRKVHQLTEHMYKEVYVNNDNNIVESNCEDNNSLKWQCVVCSKLFNSDLVLIILFIYV